jgi:hypothetical protein
MNREVHVRICERLGVKFPGPTRQEGVQPLDSFVPTERTRVRRFHERGHYDRETT